MAFAETQKLFEDVEHFCEPLVVSEFPRAPLSLGLLELFLFEVGLEISDD